MEFWQLVILVCVALVLLLLAGSLMAYHRYNNRARRGEDKALLIDFGKFAAFTIVMLSAAAVLFHTIVSGF